MGTSSDKWKISAGSLSHALQPTKINHRCKKEMQQGPKWSCCNLPPTKTRHEIQTKQKKWNKQNKNKSITTYSKPEMLPDSKKRYQALSLTLRKTFLNNQMILHLTTSWTNSKTLLFDQPKISQSTKSKTDPTGSHALKWNYCIISNSGTKPLRIILTKGIKPP